jgi:hypothetical protein
MGSSTCRCGSQKASNPPTNGKGRPVLATTLTILLIVGALGTVIGTVLWLRARAAEDVRRVVIELRALLMDAVAVGGHRASRFLGEGPRAAEQGLADLVDRVNDGKLRAACDEVLAAYRRTFAAAPGQRRPRLTIEESSPLYAAQDRGDDERRGREVTHAHETLDAIDVVLRRVNTLERFLPRRG